jgi:hypothetical protein
MEYELNNRDKKVEARSFGMILSGKGTLRLQRELAEKARQKRLAQEAETARRGKQTPL